MNAAQKALRASRILHLCFLIAAVVYMLVPFLIVSNASVDAPIVVAACLGLVAMSTIGIGLFFRGRNLNPAAERLRTNPDDTTAAGQWRGGVVLSLACAESVVLFGLALRMLGGAWSVAGGFYVVGILLLLAWTPKLELLPQ